MTTRNQRGPRTILVALAVVPMLAMSVIGSAQPAAAKAPTPGDLAKLHAAYPDFATVDSGKAQTEAGVKGQVRIGSASRAVGAGVAVLIYEWPSRAVLAKQKVGTSLALTPLAATLTTATGSFAVPSSVVGKKSARENRDLLAMLASDPTAFQEFEVDSDGNPVGDSGGPSAVAVAEGEDTPAAIAPAKRTTITTASTPVALTDATPDVAVPTNCQKPFSTLSNTWDQKGIVGHTKSTTANVDTTISYTSGATSTLGWAASAGGSKASYTSSGTKDITSSTTVTFPKKTTAHDFFRQSYWQYGRYQIQAYCGDYYPLQLKTLGWEVKPIDFTSGTAYFTGATSTGTHCASYAKSSAFSKDQTTAMTWTNGVSINTSYVDVDLSARSGWSTQVKLGYKFTRGSGSVCGTLAAPGATTTTPGDLSAK